MDSGVIFRRGLSFICSFFFALYSGGKKKKKKLLQGENAASNDSSECICNADPSREQAFSLVDTSGTGREEKRRKIKASFCWGILTPASISSPQESHTVDEKGSVSWEKALTPCRLTSKPVGLNLGQASK